jgi:hypothetical protein
VLAPETCERRESLQKSNPFLLILGGAFDTEYPSIGFGQTARE